MRKVTSLDWTTPRIRRKNGDTLFAVRLWIPKGFTGGTEHESHQEKVRPHIEGRTRNMHVVWPGTDASDRADGNMEELVDPDGLGKEEADTVSTGAC